MKSRPRDLDINGIDRDARKLHSITYERDEKNLLTIAYILIAKKDKYIYTDNYL